jgi:hypothetical protein
LTIITEYGVRKLSVFNASAVAGTVEGDTSLGSNAPGPITIAESQSWNVTVSEGSVIDKITSTAPGGCTLIVTAEV